MDVFHSFTFSQITQTSAVKRAWTLRRNFILINRIISIIIKRAIIKQNGWKWKVDWQC